MSDAMINLIVAIIEIAACIALVILYLKLEEYKIDLEFYKEIEKMYDDGLKGWHECIELNAKIIKETKEVLDHANKVLRMNETIAKSNRIFLDFMKGDEADGQD